MGSTFNFLGFSLLIMSNLSDIQSSKGIYHPFNWSLLELSSPYAVRPKNNSWEAEGTVVLVVDWVWW